MAKSWHISVLLISLIFIAECQKIKHVIVVMEENRSFDHLFGFYPGVNGLTGNEWNAYNTSDPNSKKVYVDKTAPYIAPCDPDHGTSATTLKVFGADAVSKNNFTRANMNGFVEFERKKPDACRVMSMFTPDKVPILTTLAQEYALFDRFFCSHAGPTWPNRMYFLSATSMGSTSTGTWYHDVTGTLFPQKTIFDQVAEAGLTWKNYYNDTPWELFMETIAHNTEHVASMEQFFRDCREGTLPSFGFINPLSGINLTTGVGSNDMHPDHDVAAAEQYYKDIYEAIRASPQWEETLFIITFDEHGGFYDHVPTPLNVPPPGDGESSYPEKGILFNRLGVRIPTLLISPLIPKGTVISEPPSTQKPFSNSEYDLTSIMATTRKLLGINLPPLTKRDAWAATFEHVISLDTPRNDCPIHLPPAPPVSHDDKKVEAFARPNGLQNDIMGVLSHLSGVSFPEHVEFQKDVAHWSNVHWKNHHQRTSMWKNSKKTAAGYRVICSANAKFVNSHWDVNVVKDFPKMTISTRDMSELLELPTTHKSTHEIIKYTASVPYCLDAPNITENASLTISLCYPSQDPQTNRDPAQQWIWFPDATFRPASDPTYCLTNQLSSGNNEVTLQKCVDKVQQHWAYHGKAPGDGGGGAIYYGDAANSLGVISA